MDLKHRIVIHIPLSELWTDTEVLGHNRNRYLGKEELRQMLASEPVQFVKAVLGMRLQWISDEEKFDFWKNDIKPHFLEEDSRISLDDLPDNYGYFATEWVHEGSPRIVLLEKIH